MSEAFTQFEKRLDSLERKHKELANGYVAKINPDGLITVEPKQQRGGRWTRFLLAVGAAVIMFKALALAFNGPAVYDTRVETLASGTAFEKACAWVMQADPVTVYVAGLINGFL